MDGEDSLLKEENCVASRKTSAVFNKKGKMEMDVLLKRFWSLEFHQLASVYKWHAKQTLLLWTVESHYSHTVSLL